MIFRYLLTSLALLLTVSCSLSDRTDPDADRQPPTPPKRLQTTWFLYYGSVARPFAWISGKSGRYPVINYDMKSFPLGNRGRLTEGNIVNLLIGLPQPLIGEDLTLDFPEVSYPFHTTAQPKITFRVKVNGALLTTITATQQKAAPGKPLPKQVLRFNIPSRYTQYHLLKITFEFQNLRTAAEIGGKGRNKPGIGFVFLKQDWQQINPGRAIFLVKNGGPVQNGRQRIQLEQVQHTSGALLPERLEAEFRPAACGTPEGFRQDDLVDLALQPGKECWTVLYGGLSPVVKTGQLPYSPRFAFYYPPKSLPSDNPPLPEEVISAQKKQILADLRQIRVWLKDYRRDSAREERLQREWFRRQKEYQLIPKVLSPETGQEIERYQNYYFWGKYRESFFALAKDYEFKRPTGIVHNIGALSELKRVLKSSNIQLIVMLIPDPEYLASTALMGGGRRRMEDPAAIQCAATLLEYGIEVVHTDPAVLGGARVADRLFLYPSTVPDADLWALLADLAAKRLSRFGDKAFTETTPSHYRQIRTKTVYGDNCRWPEGVNCGEHQNGEVTMSRLVLRDGSRFQPDPASKILVVGGDALNLPGPGHTFTGLLSMSLKYPVDELIPGSGIWLHNLPLVLMSDPKRWLAGKQVCLLMVSPRMLENGILPNLRTESELYAKLRRQKPVHQYKIPPKKTEVVLPVPVRKDWRFAEKTLWNRFWNQFTGTPYMIAEDGQTLTVGEFAVPKNLTGVPFTFVAQIMGYPEQSVTMIVNGRKVPLPVEGHPPYSVRPAAVELPAGTTSIRLEFSGRRGDLVRLREMHLYR